MAEDAKLVAVFSGGTMEAEIVKNVLDDAGITSYLDNEWTGIIAPWIVAPAGAGATHVVVAERDLQSAKDAIQSAQLAGSEEEDEAD